MAAHKHLGVMLGSKNLASRGDSDSKVSVSSHGRAQQVGPAQAEYTRRVPAQVAAAWVAIREMHAAGSQPALGTTAKKKCGRRVDGASGTNCSVPHLRGVRRGKPSGA